MADIHEFMVSMDLSGELSDAELADLRWHLGLGPRPERLTIITEFPALVFDDNGRPVEDPDGGWRTENDPHPVWGRAPYAASKIGGVAFSALVQEDGRTGSRSALTCRWEIHPDEHGEVAALFDWLAGRRAEHDRFFGYLRWYEEDWPDERLEIADGRLVVRREGGAVAPFGRG
ncbi:hypothetical protein AB0J86_29695 [Micromonospora sp. NPDC049559]|uniref:hypothetical protein n=1 Tax=Micromonospora sp. NPDC049559 TaxID=3155923 RepID=UPI00341D54ED